jgi:hypothetical protein
MGICGAKWRLRSARAAIFLIFAAAAAAQLRPMTFGPLELTYASDNEIEIRRGGGVWRLNLSRLIRNNDCSAPYRYRERICTGPPAAACPECPRVFGAVAWDERRSKLYFELSTGHSQNNPRTIFSYSLITRRVVRFTNTWSASLSGGVVSPSGRYLAYLNLGHGGYCANTSRVEIIDLWEDRLASPRVRAAAAGDMTDIRRLRWLAARTLEYEGVAYEEADCRASENPPMRPLKAVLSMDSLDFR